MEIKINDPKVLEKEFLTFFTKLMGKKNGLRPCPNSSVIKKMKLSYLKAPT